MVVKPLDIKNKTSAIIVAAGASVRMGTDKLLLTLQGKSVIIHTILAFENCDFIDEIVLVTTEKSLPIIKEQVKKQGLKKPIKFVLGGKNRGQSVLLGVNASSYPLLCIHDGARPLVTNEVILDALRGATAHGVATAGVLVKDTVKETINNFVTQTPDRSKLILVQTPQVFFKELYLQCIAKIGGNEFSDDCQIFEKCGKAVFVSKGDYKNIKLTTTEDILFANAILKGGNEL